MPNPIDLEQLSPSGSKTRVFEGSTFDAPVSFFLVDAGPGEGPKLHSHPYVEVFVIRDGTATFSVGAETISAQAGQIIVAPAGVAHKFVNAGSGRLRSINIHPVAVMQTEWLEED